MTSTDMDKISETQQRKRIQNRIAQRTYREKLKRRIECLEKWRDVAITATCSTTTYGDPRFHPQEHGAAPPAQEANGPAAPPTPLSQPSISTPGREMSESSLLPERPCTEGSASRAPDASYFPACHPAPPEAWMPLVDSYHLLPDDFVGSHDFPGREAPPLASSNRRGVQQVDQSDRMYLGPLARGGGHEDLSGPPHDVHESKTPLHLAAERGQQSLIKILLGRMAHAETQDSMGRTALHLAVGHKHIDAVRVLLEHQQRRKFPLINVQDNNGCSALHMAVGMEHDVMVGVLLRVPDIDIELRNSQGRTALHVAVLHGSSKVIEQLLAAGADANARVQSRGREGHLMHNAA